MWKKKSAFFWLLKSGEFGTDDNLATQLVLVYCSTADGLNELIAYVFAYILFN